MIAASLPIQRPADAKLLVLRADRTIEHAPRSTLVDRLRRDDVLIANDAATLPASLVGVHDRTRSAIEVRLAARASLDRNALRRPVAIVFGSGDFRTRTEDRPLPPRMAAGDRLQLGPLRAAVERTLDHPRLIALCFEGTASEIWAGIARHGRPIQYAHLARPLALWEVWTSIAGPPVAFEPPSAGFALDWRLLGDLRRHGVAFATLTHAAGVSTTGDAALDTRLPFDEPYAIPAATVEAIRCAKRRGGRVIAVGTTVVRALEHAARHERLRAGIGVATQRIGALTQLALVDAILSGTHEAGTSHFELLRAFADDASLREAGAELDARGYRTHEFGDSVLIERQPDRSQRCESPRQAIAA